MNKSTKCCVEFAEGYPGCQRLFLRGFRLQLIMFSTVTRAKSRGKPLVPDRETVNKSTKCCVEFAEGYPGCQRLFLRGFRLQLIMFSTVTRAKSRGKPLVPDRETVNKSTKCCVEFAEGYPGCQRLFLRGFRLQLIMFSTVTRAKSRGKPLVASAFGRRGSASGRFLPTLARKKPLVPRVAEGALNKFRDSANEKPHLR